MSLKKVLNPLLIKPDLTSYAVKITFTKAAYENKLGPTAFWEKEFDVAVARHFFPALYDPKMNQREGEATGPRHWNNTVNDASGWRSLFKWLRSDNERQVEQLRFTRTRPHSSVSLLPPHTHYSAVKHSDKKLKAQICSTVIACYDTSYKGM